MSDPRTLPQLPEATQANEADLLLLRQGIFDKHVAVSTLLAPARADATQGVQAQADRLRLTALTGGGSGALDAIPWGECVDNELAVVEMGGGLLAFYRFDKGSTAAESAPSCIKPDDAGANPGRWLQRGTVGEAELWDALYAHEARTDNPHGVTAAQVGAAPKSHASTATTYGAASESNYGHVQLANSNPAGLGTASTGTSSRAARADHVHPLPSTSQVLAALAGASVGAVGTYAFLHTAGQDEEPFVQGSIWSGSSLRYAASVVNANATNDGYYASETTVSPPGTWRAMGRFDGAASTNGLPGASLFLRIS